MSHPDYTRSRTGAEIAFDAQRQREAEAAAQQAERARRSQAVVDGLAVLLTGDTSK